MKARSKSGRRAALLYALLLALPRAASAAEVGQYIPGLVGLKSAPSPPPGFYYANLTLSYQFGQINDPSGKPQPFDGDINILGNVSSFIWSTPAKILGARYGVQVNVPFTNRAYLLDPSAGDQFGKTGIADVYVQPLTLGWKNADNHLNVRYGFFAPTGRFKSDGLTNTGKGFWTHMIGVGDTQFFGPNKEWNASAMLRYEIHTKKQGIDLKPGQNAVLEWGLGRTFAKVFDVGVVGASTWQVTAEKGMDGDSQFDYSAHGIGGEVQYAIPKARLSLRLRAIADVAARDRAQGRLIAFMLVWKP